MCSMTKEELLERIFHEDYKSLKGKKLRMTRVRVPGKEVCLAHIISSSQTSIYQNLGLSIGISAFMIGLSSVGIISALAGSVLHNFGAFAVLINSSRILKTK